MEKIVGTQMYKESVRPVNKDNKVEYIRILSKSGSWYKTGIRDGDLLIASRENNIRIARPNSAKNTYDILEFVPSTKYSDGAEHYPVFFTENEMKRYNNAIK